MLVSTSAHDYTHAYTHTLLRGASPVRCLVPQVDNEYRFQIKVCNRSADTVLVEVNKHALPGFTITYKARPLAPVRSLPPS